MPLLLFLTGVLLSANTPMLVIIRRRAINNVFIYIF